DQGAVGELGFVAGGRAAPVGAPDPHSGSAARALRANCDRPEAEGWTSAPPRTQARQSSRAYI
ncbi:MAG: hypothetical protein ACRDQH_10750, partial [Pseudonocardiaceae bacterium]